MKTISRSTPAWVFFCLFVLLAIAGTPALRAQNAAEEEFHVGTIEIKFMGLRNVSEQVVRANVQTREGTVYDQSVIDRDVRNLYRTGLFDFIEFKREMVPGGKVNLVLEVTPKFRVLSVETDGNRALKRSRLLKEVKTKPNATLDERQIKADTQALFELYQKKGYAQAEVNYSIERDRATGFGKVIFRIREGADTIIKNVRFIGNDHIGSRSLRWTMEDTRRWWIFSWATGKGRLHDDKFEEDLDKLRDRYRELGYLDVEIDRSKVKFEYPRPGKMVIVIPINEGRRYKLGRMGFTGNKLYPARFLSLALNERPGNWFSPKKLQTDAEAVEEYYGKGGYLDTRVRVIRKPNVKTGNIDVDFGITEGEKVTLESIKIEGNDKTKSVVIIRELNLVPGMPFDSIRMKSSKLRLENTRFFEDVNLTPEETKVPGRRNLKVKVTEGKTGNLTFGAGYSTLEKAVFYTELTQGNFDITNRRSFFQGDGQKFRLRLQVGTVSNAINFGFEEPWVMQRPIAVGIELRRTSNSFTSSYYDIENLGGTVYARKRLFELVEGNLAYSYDIIRYKNISTTTRSLIDVLNDNSVSKVTFTLSRDTRNKLINTSSGGRVELTTEMAGGPLGADRNFYRIEARAAQFVPLFKDQEQVLSVLVRTGVIDRFGRTTDNDLYYYNYTLGGPNSLRGFDYREVGPRVDGLVWGGKTYGFISAEYSLDVVKPMRFALFYDAGFVNRDAYEWNPSGYVDNYGIGIRLMVMGSPMSLDYGIPLRTDRFNDSGGKFNFSYGTRF